MQIESWPAQRPTKPILMMQSGYIFATLCEVGDESTSTSPLRVFETGKADVADCLIERTASSVGCGQTLRFHVNAAKYAGMRLIA